MATYTITTTEQEDIGYAFESNRTGEPIKDMIQRRVSEIGISLWHDMKRIQVADLMKKVAEDPDAYAAVIDPVYDAKVEAQAEAAKSESVAIESELK